MCSRQLRQASHANRQRGEVHAAHVAHVSAHRPVVSRRCPPATCTQDTPPEPADPRTPDERRRSMTSATAPCVALGSCSRRGSTSSIHGVVPPTSLSAWAQHLKRVFNIDVTTCVNCGGADHRPRPRSRTIGHAHPNCENQYRARYGDDPAGSRSARCREWVRNGCALRGSVPALCRNPAREHPIRAKIGACAAATYSPDCSKRAFEFPIPLLELLIEPIKHTLIIEATRHRFAM